MDIHGHLRRKALQSHLPRATIRLRLTLLYGCLFLLSGAGLLAITYALVHNALTAPLSTSGGSRPHSNGGIVHGRGPTGLQAQQAADLHQLLVQSAIALAIMAVISVGLGWLVAGRVLRPIRTMTVATRRISERSLHERLALSGPDDEIKDLATTIDGLLARLETAFESQRRFVANASHELRTPLMLTQTLLQVALADPAVTLLSLRAACEEVIYTGKEQAQLIEALLTLARSQRGLDHRDSFDVAAVVSDALEGSVAAVTAENLTLEADLGSALIAGDARLMRTLVINLVDNATRYNRPGGRIDVLTAMRAGRAVLRVANTGPVVPDDEIDRLLQPFQRLDGQRSNDRDGLGLGLSIVCAIATAHDASLCVRPQASPQAVGGFIVEVTFPPHRSETYGTVRSRLLERSAMGEDRAQDPAGRGSRRVAAPTSRSEAQSGRCSSN
jgi:signal transduction histidine kinase